MAVIKNKMLGSYKENFYIRWTSKLDMLASQMANKETPIAREDLDKELTTIFTALLQDVAFLCDVLDGKIVGDDLPPKMKDLLERLPGVIAELSERFMNAPTNEDREKARNQLRAALELGCVKRTKVENQKCVSNSYLETGTTATVTTDMGLTGGDMTRIAWQFNPTVLHPEPRGWQRTDASPEQERVEGNNMGHAEQAVDEEPQQNNATAEREG